MPRRSPLRHAPLGCRPAIVPTAVLALVVLSGVAALGPHQTLGAQVPGAPRTLTPPAPHRDVVASSATAPAAPGGVRGPLPNLDWTAEMSAAARSYHAPPLPTGARFAAMPSITPRGSNIVLNGSQSLAVATNLTVGSITLSGNATLVVQNASHRITLTVAGNIQLSGNAVFFVNGSNLLAQESYDNQLLFTATNHSRFLVLNANTSANGHQWVGSFLDDSNLTVVASYFCYPSSWFPVTVAGNASVLLLGSWFLSDLVMQDAIYLPSTAHLTIRSAIGFNMWIGLKQGAAANLSFPAPQTWQNWTFPGTFNVTGVNYSISIRSSFVGYHVLTLWSGSSVVVRSTPGLVIALDPVGGSLTLSGFQEGWLNWTFQQGGFNIRLFDVRIDSWNLYPFSDVVTVTGSQFGEILANTNAQVTVRSSNLTGHGGYYGTFGTSSLSVYDSAITDQVIGNDQGTILLSNCSDSTSTPQRILAAGASTIRAFDVRLGPQVTYAAMGTGEVWVAWSAWANVTTSGAPSQNAVVAVRWASNGTLAASAVTPSNGTVKFTLLSELVEASVARALDAYEVTATLGDSGASTSLLLTVTTHLSLLLVPLIQATSPANDSVGVSIASNVTITFGLAMNTSATDAAVSVTPALSITPSWSATSNVLTLQPVGLQSNTSYVLRFAAGASTQSGIPLPTGYSLEFKTAAAPAIPAAPAVTASDPANGSTDVSPWQNVTLTFSLALNATTLAGAVAVSPTVPGASITVSGTVVRWTHPHPLEPNTSYRIGVDTTATTTSGGRLPYPVWTEFTTAPLATPSHRPSSASGGVPGVVWAIVGIVATLALVGIALLLARRGRDPPTTYPPGASSPLPAPRYIERPAWSES